MDKIHGASFFEIGIYRGTPKTPFVITCRSVNFAMLIYWRVRLGRRGESAARRHDFLVEKRCEVWRMLWPTNGKHNAGVHTFSRTRVLFWNESSCSSKCLQARNGSCLECPREG